MSAVAGRFGRLNFDGRSFDDVLTHDRQIELQGLLAAYAATLAVLPTIAPISIAMLANAHDGFLRDCAYAHAAMLTEFLAMHDARAAACATNGFSCALVQRTHQRLSAAATEVQMIGVFQIASRAKHRC